MSLQETSELVMMAISDCPGAKSPEIAEVVGVSKSTVSSHGRRLAEAGRVVLRGQGRGRRYYPARAPEADRAEPPARDEGRDHEAVLFRAARALAVAGEDAAALAVLRS